MNARRLLIPACLALLWPFPPVAGAERLEPPHKQPKDGVAFGVRIRVPWSTFELGKGRDEEFAGKLKCWKPEGEKYLVATDFALRDGAGRALALPEEISFCRNKEGDAQGGAEFLPGSAVPREQRYRLVASSDFALVPLRMLFPHEMPTSRGGAPAAREIDHEDFHVAFEEKFGGVDMVSITPLRTYAGRTVRTFRPSGFQLIDYTLTWEDERDQTVMAAFGLRLLVHPTRPLPSGEEAPAGLFHCAIIEVEQLDWRRESPVIAAEEWERRLPKWRDRLGDQLFDAIAREAVGDPFNSPAVLALRIMRALDEDSLNRLVSTADARRLAPLAPLLVDLPLAFDPARLLEAREKTVDPVERLLLAAAAAAAGSVPAGVLAEAEIALHSRQALEQCTRDDERIEALRALAACGGAEARTAIEEVLMAGAAERVRAAALLALARLGDPADEALLDDAEARFGAPNPATGIFELLLADPVQAGDALLKVNRLAALAAGGEVAEVLRSCDAALKGAGSSAPPERALAAAVADWLAEMGPLVPSLAEHIGDRGLCAVARRVAHAAGRSVVPDLLRRLQAARGPERLALARLAGATRDPRVRAPLDKLRDSKDLAEIEAGDAGWDELHREGP
ncbi:MAG: hypothetical protein HY812_17970 [Planctomycetes bacterium]|nr:hypothetical protein [Planctomycetota bacterium]